MEDEGEQAEVMALMHSGPECPAQFSLIGDTCYLQVKEIYRVSTKKGSLTLESHRAP